MAEIKMYTRELCGYCSAAKSLLESKQLAFEEIDCTDDDQIRSWLRVKSGQSTVPQIFINGQPIGGFTELRNLERSGRLEKMLTEEPAAEEEEP